MRKYFHQKNWILGVIGAASALLYYVLLYETPRTQFLQLWGLFLGLFAGYFWWIFQVKKMGNSLLAGVLIAGITFRLLALFALPELSDDYFRFIWDGRLLAHGVNPFAQKPLAIAPASYLELGLSPELFNHLNSPNYFTIYPPVCQGVFWVAAQLSPQSIYGAVVVMKSFFFMAELGSMFLIYQLLKLLNLPSYNLAFYALNPLVIVEFVGNLHFEAFMVFFLLLSLLWLLKGKWAWATAPFALAVCSKLVPLIFLPLLIRRLGWGKSIAFGGMVGGICVLAFLPILDLATIVHLADSTSLYFQSFEFNASIYYFLREIGIALTGYNQIAVIGKGLAIATVISILVFVFSEKRPKLETLAGGMLWALMIYFALATTVHPWYICSMVAICGFTNYRFPLIWSLLLPLTYATYLTSAYTELLWLVVLEYSILGAFIWYELQKLKTSFPSRPLF